MVSSQCPLTCSSVLAISSATMLPRHSALVAATWRVVTTCHVSRVSLHGDPADGDADAGEGLQGGHGQQEESQQRRAQTCDVGHITITQR